MRGHRGGTVSACAMMKKRINCWEYMSCGRQPSGRRVTMVGPCPAATATELDGINNGKAGGRFCWTVDGTLCPGNGKDRIARCVHCPFMCEVAMQEGEFFVAGVDLPDELSS